MEQIKVYVDEKGMHQLQMPDGTQIPCVCKTVVKQDVEQAQAGVCTVIAVFENVPLLPTK